MTSWNPLDQCLIVTGASSGIGRAIAQQLVELGATVYASARRTDRLEALQHACRDARGSLVPVSGDLCDPNYRQRLIDRVKADHRVLHGLINAAGVGAIGPFEAATEARLRTVFEVNFFSAVELTRIAIPALRAGNTRIICNIGSVLGHVAVPGKSEYSASKHALHGWTNALRAELAAAGFHVTLISPSTTQTEFFTTAIDATPGLKWNRFGSMTADQVATIAIKALRYHRREVILSPGGKLLVWAHRICPPLVARILAR